MRIARLISLSPAQFIEEATETGDDERAENLLNVGKNVKTITLQLSTIIFRRCAGLSEENAGKLQCQLVVVEEVGGWVGSG